MKLNLVTLSEDCRRLGIILSAAGLIAGFLEGGQVINAGPAALFGLALLWYGNLEK